MFNLQQARANLNDVKPVTVEIARILLRNGMAAIGSAIEMSLPKLPAWQMYQPELPGGKKRDEVLWKLKWHQAELAGPKYAGAPQFTIYEPGNDLKEWTLQAYVEANAAEQGSMVLQQAWDSMVSEIKTELARIPSAVVKAAAQTAASAVSAVIPWWMWVGLGCAAVGTLGYGIYRFRSRR